MVYELQKVLSKPESLAVSFNHDRDSVILRSVANHFNSCDGWCCLPWTILV